MGFKPLTVRDVLQTGYQKFIVERRLPSSTADCSFYRLRVDGLEYRDLIGWCLPTALLNQLDLEALTKYNEEFDTHAEWLETSGISPDDYDYVFSKSREDYYPIVSELVAKFPQYFDPAVVEAEAKRAHVSAFRLETTDSLSALTYYLHDEVSSADGRRPRWTISIEKLKERYETAFTLAGLRLPGSSSIDDAATA